jgi:hypothetical protein
MSAQDTSIRVPESIGSVVLPDAVRVVRRSRHVRTNVERIRSHARWLAAEELPYPEFVLPFGIGERTDEAIDFLMVSSLLNFAFTDFSTREVFRAEYGGRTWSDAEALFACLKRALDEGLPVLDGRWMAGASQEELRQIFRGNIELPLLAERAEILREAGQVLEERYDGRFVNFVRSGPARVYAQGRGLLERLVREFPRYRDVSMYDGEPVRFYKLAQLALWGLHACLRRRGGFALEDPETLTAFADYIVPLGLEAMGVLEYTPELARRIEAGELIPRDSEEEIEIRAHTIYAVALMTEEVNRLRPAHLQVINAQMDARLWTHYHATFRPHHLTRTIMY